MATQEEKVAAAPLVGGAETALHSHPNEHALVLGIAGVIATTGTEQADFRVIVPFNMTLLRLKATLKTAATGGTTTTQIRRSTDSGATYVNAFGTVDIVGTALVGSNDPVDADVNEGDVLDIDVTAVGTGSPANLAVFVIGKVR